MQVNRSVFLISASLILLFVLLAALFATSMEEAFTAIQHFIVTRFGWFYIASVGFFLIFIIAIGLSPFGRIKLGRDDEEPEYGHFSWLAMLFSAGMGIGLLFFSVAEPIMHFSSPIGLEPGTAAAARFATRTTFFHWGLHAWAIYAVTGLALSFFAYRRNLPLTIRSTLHPLIGERIHGPLGDLVEILAVFGTLFGVATSLGLGVMQINAGLTHLGLMEISTNNQLYLIAGITFLATLSVVAGLDAGIKKLSEINMVFGVILVLFVFLVGPTAFLMSSFVQSIGDYVQNIVQLTFRTHAFRGMDWQESWTMFYWGWWISWSPFVGMFIARISRGRTIRQFITGVLVVPTLLTFFWLVVFGNTALHIEIFGSGGISEAVAESVPVALFVLLEKLPLASVSSLFASLVIATFFITSSDSGSLVIDVLTSGGNPNPPLWKRIFWAVTEGVVAAILLMTGGLIALQTAAITTALPFCAVMLVMCYSLYKGLKMEKPTPKTIPHRSLRH